MLSYKVNSYSLEKILCPRKLRISDAHWRKPEFLNYFTVCRGGSSIKSECRQDLHFSPINDKTDPSVFWGLLQEDEVQRGIGINP